MTSIIEIDNYYDNCIYSLIMDYQAQVLYWVYCDYHNRSLTVNSSNADGTIRQTIQLPIRCYDRRFQFRRCRSRYSLTLFKDVLYLSSSDTNEIYRVQLNGENITTIIRSSDICTIYYWTHLKVVGEYRSQGDIAPRTL